jgi:hypothetical protein
VPPLAIISYLLHRQRLGWQMLGSVITAQFVALAMMTAPTASCSLGMPTRLWIPGLEPYILPLSLHTPARVTVRAYMNTLRKYRF